MNRKEEPEHRPHTGPQDRPQAGGKPTARPGGHEGKIKAPATTRNSDQGREPQNLPQNQGTPSIPRVALHDKEENRNDEQGTR